MVIAKLLANAAFDPGTVALLSSAFDTAWDQLKKSGSVSSVEASEHAAG
jgi:hypothetical protein